MENTVLLQGLLLDIVVVIALPTELFVVLNASIACVFRLLMAKAIRAREAGSWRRARPACPCLLFSVCFCVLFFLETRATIFSKTECCLRYNLNVLIASTALLPTPFNVSFLLLPQLLLLLCILIS